MPPWELPWVLDYKKTELFLCAFIATAIYYTEQLPSFFEPRLPFVEFWVDIFELNFALHRPFERARTGMSWPYLSRAKYSC